MQEHPYTFDTSDKSEIERLLVMGFTPVEAYRLAFMKSHVDEEVEYRELLEENRRLDFVRWLIDHNHLSK